MNEKPKNEPSSLSNYSVVAHDYGDSVNFKVGYYCIPMLRVALFFTMLIYFAAPGKSIIARMAANNNMHSWTLLPEQPSLRNSKVVDMDQKRKPSNQAAIEEEPKFIYQSLFRPQRYSLPESTKDHQIDVTIVRLKQMLVERLLAKYFDEFNLDVLQMNVTVHSIKIIKLQLPEIKYDKLNPTKLKATASGGDALVQADYTCSYKTIRRGTIEITLQGFKTEIILDGRPGLYSLSECSPSVDQVSVELKPRLLEDVDQAISEHVKTNICTAVCYSVNSYLSELFHKTKS
ncbi:hypothetical protein DdX_00142 [Ditylenchus destructor]|uniref:Uncharacterized protein n=1 Tax=Ditylenchus destructor TaxID=166010 RepID=A0AAD4NJE6_9BILA|nr:hypothetical protein DdX_00142 [Ditylenchus destructor]